MSDNSEVCHPRCAFKLYGEVNSVKKHNYKIWLNGGVYSKEKLHVSAYSGHHSDNDDEISTLPRGLGILHKTVLAENCQSLKMAAIGRNI